MATEEQLPPQDWKLVLAQKRFLYRTEDLPGRDPAALKAEILSLLTSHDAAGHYVAVCEESGWGVDGSEVSRMRAANVARLAELDAAVADAQENAGEVEVRDALVARAEYLVDCMDSEGAASALATAAAATAGAGLKLDLAFSELRLDMALGRWAAVGAGLTKAATLSAAGGDWERRNKLKAYEAVFALASRRVSDASRLLLDCVATFSATELMPYTTLVFYAVLSGMLSLPRPELKSRVLDCPEILAVIGDVPHLSDILSSLHGARYRAFFAAFDGLNPALAADGLLAPHAAFLHRELRVVAYAQYLEPYRTVTLAAMAAAFGVGVEFVDAQLSQAILAGRLQAKIDRVAGVVNATRPDPRAAKFAQALKAGDALLTRVQNLSRVIDIE